MNANLFEKVDEDELTFSAHGHPFAFIGGKKENIE